MYLGCVLGLMACLCVGCSSWVKPLSPEQAQIKRHHDLERKLTGFGISVIHLGDTVRLTAPHALFFHPNSARFQSKTRYLIYLLHEYMLFYRTVRIEVAAYLERCSNIEWAEQLTQARADRLVQALARYPVDTRLLVGNGYGNCCAQGPCMQQDRIEFRFRYVYPP